MITVLWILLVVLAAIIATAIIRRVGVDDKRITKPHPMVLPHKDQPGVKPENRRRDDKYVAKSKTQKKPDDDNFEWMKRAQPWTPGRTIQEKSSSKTENGL